MEVTSNSTKMAIMAVVVRANSTVAEDIDRGVPREPSFSSLAGPCRGSRGDPY